jgi:hypothetical protein
VDEGERLLEELVEDVGEFASALERFEAAALRRGMRGGWK